MPCERHPPHGALLGKFAQHGPSREALLATAGTVLAEAPNSDPTWGIGLAECDPAAWSVSEWRGANWLGEVLTAVREDILAGTAERRRGRGAGGAGDGARAAAAPPAGHAGA